MTYKKEERHAYYIRNRDKFLEYSRRYTLEHKGKYITYYKEYNRMMRELEFSLVYKDDDEKNVLTPKKNQKIKPAKKEPKPKDRCDVCETNFKGSYKQHLVTARHLINEQSIRSKLLKSIKNNIMTSTNIKYMEMFSLKDLKEALVQLGHQEVEAMEKEELYAYIIALINAEELSEDETNSSGSSSDEEVDYHGLVFKCAYSE
jgi:hypothetical protein